jgi:non-ribosomal peptide synthetase component F
MSDESERMKCLVELFQDYVSANPDAIALEDSTEPGLSQQLTYRELDTSSDRLSIELRNNGVTAGQVVPILSGRCTGSITAILAVLKLRACYVPMDIDTWGVDRIESTLDRVKPALIITTNPGVQSNTAEQYHILHIRRDGRGFEFLARQDDPSTVVPQEDTLQSQQGSIEEDWAYLIFTSGSTGKPKGVIVNQKSVSTLVTQRDPHLPFNLSAGFGDRVLLIFSFAFDGECLPWCHDYVRKLTDASIFKSLRIRCPLYALQWCHARSFEPCNIGRGGRHLLNMDHHTEHPRSYGPDEGL